MYLMYTHILLAIFNHSTIESENEDIMALRKKSAI